MPNFRISFSSGSLLFSYLILGSVLGLEQVPKSDDPHGLWQFAQTLPRKVYAYSVVPGGVESPEELEAARRTDPVVAEHFKDFGDHTYITTLPEDRYVYVGYRIGNKVFYTKTKHKVCKGEEVITDAVQRYPHGAF